MTKQTKHGFTLIELMVVISIIGLLSSVVLSAVNSARKKTEVTQMNQIAEEYRKAVMLAYDEDGSYPYPGAVNTVYCLGDYPPVGAGNYGTLDVCGVAAVAGSYLSDENAIVLAGATGNEGVKRFLPSLPTMKEVFYTTPAPGSLAYKFKGPWYVCTLQSGGKCTNASIRWRLGLPNQQCIKGVVPSVTSVDSTFCNLNLN